LSLLAVVCAGSIGFGASFAQSTPGVDEPAAKQTAAPVKKPAASAKKPAATRVPSRYHTSRFPKRAELNYQLIWGVDALSVRWAESGEIIRFSYRVLDAEKARTLNDAKIEPSLVDPRAGVSLVVPSLEKVGKLRQSESPEAGKSYWMAFSNKGRPVKRGDRVDIVIGQFHADGLVVD
jgi:hypothetical protein